MVVVKVDRKGKKQSMRQSHFHHNVADDIVCVMMILIYFGLGYSEIAIKIPFVSSINQVQLLLLINNESL